MENVVSGDSLRSFFGEKRVLITGHTGFKGAWLTAVLHRLGAVMKGFALEPDGSNLVFECLSGRHLIDGVIADVRDRKRVADEILSFQPDFVFHLAAQSLVLRSYEIPADTFDVNVTGTANLLEALRGLDRQCTVVVVTTDKVYKNREDQRLYKEDDELGGHDPYSASKAATEIAIQSFRDSFFNGVDYLKHGKAVTSARAGNVIGGGDMSANRIIPDIVRALKANKPVKVRNPTSVRPWQHVLEPLVGYLSLAAALHRHPAEFSTPFNFGPLPEDHLSVREVVQMVLETWGEGSMEVVKAEQPHEAGLLKLDISKAMTRLGWKPRLNAKEAIEWTVDWYKMSPEARAHCTFDQIDAYLSK